MEWELQQLTDLEIDSLIRHGFDAYPISYTDRFSPPDDASDEEVKRLRAEYEQEQHEKREKKERA